MGGMDKAPAPFAKSWAVTLQ